MARTRGGEPLNFEIWDITALGATPIGFSTQGTMQLLGSPQQPEHAASQYAADAHCWQVAQVGLGEH
jgi:hypothetical protein